MAVSSPAQPVQDEDESAIRPTPLIKMLRTLPVPEARRLKIEQAIAGRDYDSAEGLLAEEAKNSSNSQELLLVLAHVLFLDGKQLNASVVLRKAELLGPLDERNRFLLALSYISINERRLAVPELQRLMQANPANALYPYWLSRMAYRDTNLDSALRYAETAVRLGPTLAKAYDQLGLCLAGLDRTDEAIAAYQQAIRLGEQQRLQWPWPAMNLGTLLLRLERLDDAESALRLSLKTDPRFPVAHLRLAKVLETREQWEPAIAELKEAARCDPTYPEPHYALARIYRKLKDFKAAQAESGMFAELRDADRRKGITRPD